MSILFMKAIVNRKKLIDFPEFLKIMRKNLKRGLRREIFGYKNAPAWLKIRYNPQIWTAYPAMQNAIYWAETTAGGKLSNFRLLSCFKPIVGKQH